MTVMKGATFDTCEGMLTLNVGGSIYQTCASTLERYPNTRLGQLSHSSHHYIASSNQYFFDRNPIIFQEILDFYRTGYLHLPSGSCGAVVRQEMEYWEISMEHLCECCLNTYLQSQVELDVITNVNRTFESVTKYSEAECSDSRLKWVLNKVWLLLDEPKSSVAAMIFNFVFMLVVLLSMVTFVLGSHRDFRDELLPMWKLHYIRRNLSIRFFDELDLNNPKMIMLGTSLPSQYLRDIEIFCSIFFAVEFVLHFISCPIKRKFFLNPLNFLDPVLLASMWSCVYIEHDLKRFVRNYPLTRFYLYSKALVVLRLFRFFRMIKIYSGLRILLLSIQASLRELFLLLMCVLVASVFFASFIYYAEFNVPDTFENIFEGMWWAVITMTTVGFGDMVPKSVYGYIVGCFCAFFGVLLVSMPIAVVATNFNEFYQISKLRDMKKKLMKTNVKETTKKNKSNEITCKEDEVMQIKVSPMVLQDI